MLFSSTYALTETYLFSHVEQAKILNLRELPRGQRISQDSARILVEFRLSGFRACIRESQLKHPGVPKDVLVFYRLREDLIGYIMHQEENASPGLAVYPEHYGSWWSELQQRFLIYNYLRYLVPKSPELKSMVVGNTLAIMAFTRDVISKTHPEEAAAIEGLVGCQASWDYVETRRENAERETERLKQSRENDNGSVHFFTLPTS